MVAVAVPMLFSRSNPSHVASGTPDDTVKAKRSYTGRFLAPVLRRSAQKRKKRIEAAE
jgi:excinuclease ABC subunit A